MSTVAAYHTWYHVSLYPKTMQLVEIFQTVAEAADQMLSRKWRNAVLELLGVCGEQLAGLL